MFKKRGRIGVVVLGISGVLIVVLFALIFFGDYGKTLKKTYALSDEEIVELKSRIEEMKIDAYPECKAFLERDAKYCEEAESDEDKSDCRSYIASIMAVSTKNESYCDTLPIDNQKRLCKEYSKGIVDCNSFDENTKLYCLALVNEDVSYCENTESEKLKEFCKGEIMLILAAKDEDNEKCNDIPQEWIRDYCNAWISGDKNECVKKVDIDEDEIKKIMAVEMWKEMICYNMSKTKEKELCILEFAMGNPELCEDILTKDIKKACGSMLRQDKGSCESVENERARMTCNVNIYEG